MANSILVRENPSLRHVAKITGLNGRKYRWATDESDAANVASNLIDSSTMPGGHEQLDGILARNPRIDYDDLERLSTIQIFNSMGVLTFEGRLEGSPRVSGDQFSISPSAVGWRAALDDDKTAKEIFRDADLTRWGGFPNPRVVQLGTAYICDAGAVEIRQGQAGASTLALYLTRLAQGFPPTMLVEAWYNAAGIPIGAIYYSANSYDGGGGYGGLSATWSNSLQICTDDKGAVNVAASGDLIPGLPSKGTLVATSSGGVFAFIEFLFGAANTSDGEWRVEWNPVVYGRHGISIRGAEPSAGFYSSDVIPYILSKWAPVLNFTTGPGGTIATADFIIPQLAFPDETTAGEMIRQADRFELYDWAVWGRPDDPTGPPKPTYYYQPRNARGRKWRASAYKSSLKETGPTVARLFNGVVVKYNDVDGSLRSVGPPGTRCRVTNSQLVDADPANPANKRGLLRYDVIQMNGVSTVAGATRVGLRYITEAKQLDNSGEAVLPAIVWDANGAAHTYSEVQGGDQVSFYDTNDTSYRRIIRAVHDHAACNCPINLDAPPQGIQALEERMDIIVQSMAGIS